MRSAMSHILKPKSGRQYAKFVPSYINAMCILDTRSKWTDGQYSLLCFWSDVNERWVCRHGNVESEQVRGPSHVLKMLERVDNELTSPRVPDLNESLCQANMQTVSHRVSAQASKYTCYRQTRPDETRQCRVSMNNIHIQPWIRAFETCGILPMSNLQ